MSTIQKMLQKLRRLGTSSAAMVVTFWNRVVHFARRHGHRRERDNRAQHQEGGLDRLFRTHDPTLLIPTRWYPAASM